MNRVFTLRKLITSPLLRIKTFFPESIILKILYFHNTGKWLNLKNPRSFNEKLQWLKLNDRKTVYTIMADKIESKRWVKERIGSKYIIPNLGIWETVKEIQLSKLPDKFVLKTNHDSGGIIICKNKEDLKKEWGNICKKLNKSLQNDYYKAGLEWPYKNIKRKIFAEKLLEVNTEDIPDYKFFCFNGKVKFFKIDTSRSTNHHATYFYPDWTMAPFREEVYPNIPDPTFFKKPKNFIKMIALAEELSKDIAFLRVDFYNINGEIFFGEMTFYPAAGFGRIVPYKWEKKIGDMIKL